MSRIAVPPKRSDSFKGLENSAIAGVIESIWDKYDVDGSGDLDREETRAFVLNMGNLVGSEGMGEISDEDFNDVFNMFDADKSGTVEKDEMVDFIKHFLGGDD
jgi:Ca2+-binding EF-hand superfamily protein